MSYIRTGWGPLVRRWELVNYIRTHWDRLGGWLGIAVGGIALIGGWVGVSRSTSVSEQLPYVVSGGIGGLFLLGLGVGLLLSADLRDEWRKLDAIEELLAADKPPNAAQMVSVESDRGATATDSSRPAEVPSQGAASAAAVMGPGRAADSR